MGLPVLSRYPRPPRSGMLWQRGGRRQLWRVLIAAIAVSLIGSGGAIRADTEPAQRHPLRLEDVLDTEGIGAAQFSPNGRWLAYNLVPPYARLSDYSYWMRAYGLSGHQLWVKAMDEDAAPYLQPGLNPDATSYLMGFSPGSTHVVVLEHKRGRFRLVACRTGEASCVRFDPMPDIRDRYVRAEDWNAHPVWTSDDTFVMPVRDATLPGSEMRNRAATGMLLWQAWNQAWSGQGATASEAVSTGRDRSADWAAGDLAEFNIETGKVSILAAGRYAGVRASPDGRLVLAARVAERERPPSDAHPVASETHPMFDRHYVLSLIDRTRGTVRQAPQPFNVDPGSLTWSQTSQRFAVFGWDKAEKPENGQFYIVDAATLMAQPLSHAGLELANSRQDPAFKWWPGPASAALLDTGLAVLARPASDGRQDWYLLRVGASPLNLSAGVQKPSGDLLTADRRGITLMADGAVYRLTANRDPARLTPEGDRFSGPVADAANPADARFVDFTPTSPRIGEDTRQDLILAQGDPGMGESRIWFGDMTPRRAAWRHIALNMPGAHVLAASVQAQAAVVTVKEGAATRLLMIRKDAGSSELARINAHLNAVQSPGTRRVSYALHDPQGAAPPRPVTACLLLPPGYDPAKRYPVLMEVYPIGIGGNCRTFTDSPAPGAMVPELWTSRGFIHVLPAIPLDLARTPDDPLGGLGDLLGQTVDALADAGVADPDGIVLFGMSQGGIASLAGATQSDRFAAVISINGWADYFSHYFGARGLMRYFHLDQNGGDNRWRYECAREGPSHDCPFGFGVAALADPERYARTSPVAKADSITAPVLLVHSDFDYFGMAQYDEMFGALYRAGKDARYVRYWGEGHGPSSPANIRDLWMRIDAFLAESGVAVSQAEPDRSR